MFSSPILRKLKRAIRGKRAGKAAKPVVTTYDLAIDAMAMDSGKRLRLSVRPALAAVNVVVQLSTHDGRVVCNHTLEARTVRIAPGHPMEVLLPVDSRRLPVGIASYMVDVSQEAHHVHREIVLASRGDRIEIGYPTVEAFLKTRALVDVSTEALVPSGRDERLSMAHLKDEDFVQYCYFWLLGRDADPSGMENYLKALANGLSRPDAITGMFKSEESVNFRRLSPVSLSGQGAYPFSAAHDRMRLAMGAVENNKMGAER